MSAPDTPPKSDGFPSKDRAREILRNQIEAAGQWAYFDHAAVSPIPTEAAEAGRKLLAQAAEAGDFHWPEWSAIGGRLRSNGAELLHCDPSEIALIPNTTFGINLIANAFPWFEKLPGRSSTPNVVVIDNEFSSNLIPWQELARQGVEVRRIPVDETGIVSLDRIREGIDSSTRLVSISWVSFLSGYRVDLPTLCEMVHDAGAELFLDAIQGLGVFPCDLSQIPIDYVAADGHKWLLGPEGAGVMFIRQNRIEALKPLMLGWNSVQSPHQFSNASIEYKKDASKFEGGSPNFLGIVCLERSMRLLLDLGCHLPDNGVMNAVLENAELVQSSLQKVGAIVHRDMELASSRNTHGSGIVTFSVPDADPVFVRSELVRHKVMVSVRHGRLRVATHAYNNADDVARLCDVVQHVERNSFR